MGADSYESRHNPMDESEVGRVLRVLKTGSRLTLVEGFRLVETAEALRKNVMRLADELVKCRNHVEALEAIRTQLGREVEELEADNDELHMSPCNLGSFREDGSHKCGLQVEIDRLEADSAKTPGHWLAPGHVVAPAESLLACRDALLTADLNANVGEAYHQLHQAAALSSDDPYDAWAGLEKACTDDKRTRHAFMFGKTKEDETMTHEKNTPPAVVLRLKTGSELAGKFQTVTGELYREYIFPGGDTYRIDEPRYIAVKRAVAPGDTDSHRVVDGAGVSHYVKPAEGWAIRWKVRDGEPHFLF